VAHVTPQVRRRPITAETAQTLGTMLESVVTVGTGSKAAVAGYRVAGKTGTSQKIDPDTGAYSSALSVASFAGYVPADDPRMTIIVIVDEPRGEAWGGTVAAPIFRRVAEQSLTYLGISSQEPTKVALMERPGIGPGIGMVP
jgi:cell division protein FtsI (penicillin-binding protein 3)